MAQIHIEPKPRRGALPFVLGLLVVAAIAAAIWFLMLRDTVDYENQTEPAAAVDTVAAA